MWVQPVGNGYADIIRNGRRFRFSHETITRDETGAATTWLVFDDAPTACPGISAGVLVRAAALGVTQGMVWPALETGKRAACACSSLLLLLPAKGSAAGAFSSVPRRCLLSFRSGRLTSCVWASSESHVHFLPSALDGTTRYVA